MTRDDLDTAILQAHDNGDAGDLAALYTRAADVAEESGRVDAACFFLTHALVFALEAGADAATVLARRLADYGRMPPGSH